ncbi:Crp/Fnr family transcriptional regulator [Labrys portucalensis]|uniref:Crp/Fnr family transcriptional regulator n=1 Tax=Labrys neptuniae TaxID=376174 RepID=A0ABV6ZE02_9HYPH
MPRHFLAAPVGRPAGDRDPLLDFLARNAGDLDMRAIVMPKGGSLDTSMEVCVLFLVSGRLTICVPTRDGTDVFVTELSPGELVGEACALEGLNVPLSVTAAEASVVWSIRQAAFKRCLEDKPDFAIAVMNAMCRRLCRANLRLVETAVLSARERLHAEILRLASRTEGPWLGIARLPTHDELAVRVGTQREVVTKELSKLRRAGTIVSVGRGIRIMHPAHLARRGV